MLKVFLGILLVSTTSYLGYRFADKYKYRLNVFENLYTFNMHAVSKIGFNAVTVEELATELKRLLPQTFKNLDAFLYGEPYICEDKKLTVGQRAIITNYINSFGLSDALDQKNLLLSFGELLKNEELSAKTNSLKFSGLSVRLGFSLGLIITVIII